MEKTKIFPLTRESLKIFVIILSVVSLLLACSTAYLLLKQSLTENTTGTKNHASSIKTFCEEEPANILCKIIPKNNSVTESDPEGKAFAFLGKLETVTKAFSGAGAYLDCDKNKAYENKGCNFAVGNQFYISFVRSEERNGNTYEIYKIILIEKNGALVDNSEELLNTSFLELNINTNEATNVSEREKHNINTVVQEQEKITLKAIEAIKQYLKITETGVYEPAFQTPAKYTFKDNSSIQITESCNGKEFLSGDYTFVSNSQRFFRIDLGTYKVTEINVSEWSCPD